MTIANHLCLFLRVPRIGRVKTRLAHDIGVVAAWSFYRARLERTIRVLAGDPRWRLWLAVTPDGAADFPLPRGRPVIGQGTGDLGRRMTRVIDALPPGPAVIVGADAPDLTSRHIAQAFKALGHVDAVFGPAADGGYWLVGLRRRPPPPRIFDNVRWSSEHALADTIENLGGCPHVLLETLEDVDDGAAYDLWRRRR